MSEKPPRNQSTENQESQEHLPPEVTIYAFTRTQTERNHEIGSTWTTEKLAEPIKYAGYLWEGNFPALTHEEVEKNPKYKDGFIILSDESDTIKASANQLSHQFMTRRSGTIGKMNEQSIKTEFSPSEQFLEEKQSGMKDYYGESKYSLRALDDKETNQFLEAFKEANIKNLAEQQKEAKKPKYSLNNLPPPPRSKKN